MARMFSDAARFKGTGLDKWNVSNLQNATRMFYGSLSFDTDLSNWDMAQAISMNEMFTKALKFKGIGLEHWNVSKVQDMSA
jgi:hypothetical protein